MMLLIGFLMTEGRARAGLKAKVLVICCPVFGFNSYQSSPPNNTIILMLKIFSIFNKNAKQVTEIVVKKTLYHSEGNSGFII
ncbi:hypothetical protein NF98_21255 [Salmonella enterica subsp. enterica serovar Rubislaw]|nr:hypothetical protein [Salmonella enterica]EBL5124199.1 hypothetical protein [Salmonella enterica subsp. enterica serovar Rubislaw]EDV3149333.1 hypothetical protein [Salmonella enterica subsp. enterica serovar Chandans]